MLKFIFAILLLVNAALFAYQQGHLAPWFSDSREPARLARQIDVDKIRLLPADSAAKKNDAPAPPPANEPAASADGAALSVEAPLAILAAATDTGKPLVVASCAEIGNFSESEAQTFESQLTPLALGSRLSRRAIQEGGSQIVFIPPQGSKEGADKKVGELRRLGVTDFFVIQDNSPLRWAVSLGMFRTEEAARNRLAQLNQQGVRSARIASHNATTRIAFQLRDLDPAAKEKLEKIRLDYPQQDIRACA